MPTRHAKVAAPTVALEAALPHRRAGSATPSNSIVSPRLRARVLPLGTCRSLITTLRWTPPRELTNCCVLLKAGVCGIAAPTWKLKSTWCNISKKRTPTPTAAAQAPAQNQRPDADVRRHTSSPSRLEGNPLPLPNPAHPIPRHHGRGSLATGDAVSRHQVDVGRSRPPLAAKSAKSRDIANVRYVDPTERTGRLSV